MLTPARRVRSHSAVNSEPGSSSCPSPGQPREPVIFPVAGNCVGPAGLSSFPSPGHFNKRPSSFSALSDGNPLDDGGGKGPPLPHHPVAALRRAAVLACCPKMKKTPLSPCYSTPIEKVRFGSIRIGKKASMRERPKELRLAKEEMFDDDSPTHVLETVLAQDKTKKDDGQRDSLLTGKLSLAKSFRRKTRRDRPLAQSRNPAEVEVVPLPAEASRILTIEMDVTMRLRKLSEAFFNQNDGQIDLMNDWEIGGTQNKWVCPSDRHLQLRAQLKSGWSVRTAAARSPTNAAKVQPSAISDAEQEQIRKVLERVEESRQREQQRIGKMVDRLDKMRKRATGNGVTHCLLCHTEFGLLASKSYAAMCTDCRKYVCQRNCGVETVEPKTGELIFLCKICAESREVLWKKSGAWFYKEMPEYVKPEIAASQPGPSSPPGAWGGPSSSRNGSVRRLLPTPPSTTPDSSRQLPTTPDELRNTATPRPRIQPSWVKEKVMTSMSVEEDDHSSSESEFVASGVVRRKKDPPTKQITQARREANLERFAQITSNNLSESEESSSPASSRSGSPRRSLATPSSFDSAHVGGPNPIPRHPSQTPTHSSTPANAGGIPHEAKSGNEDARSIDSGVVQSDHSNPVAAMTLSVSSLAPLAASTQDAQSRKLQSRQGSCDSRRVSNESTPRRDSADRENSGSRNSIGRESTRVTTSVSGSSLVTPPPLAMNQRRESPLDIRKLSISSGSTKRAGTSTDSMNIIEAIRFTNNARADSPGAAFMSSPDDDSKQHGARRNALARGSKARPPPTRALSDRDPTRQLSQDDEGGNPAPASLVQASVRRSASGLEPSLVASPVATRAATPLSDEIASTSTTRPPLEPGTLGSIQFNITYKQEQKQIVVHLIRAKNLRAMDKNGFSDPYVKLHLIPGNAKATKLTSKTIEKTLNPEWNEELTYHGITEEDRQRKTLRVTVLDRDRIGSDFLGETRVALKKLPSNEIKKFNLYLEHAIPIQQDKKEGVTEERGKVLVGVQYNIQQGSLFVFMKRGSELVGMDKSGFSDPYCKVSLTPITSKAHRQKTAIKKRTLNPEWDETLPFIVPFKDLPKKTLQIAVYDHDVGSRDDYIGGIVLSTSAKGERGKQWIQVIENPGQTFEYWHRLELDS